MLVGGVQLNFSEYCILQKKLPNFIWRTFRLRVVYPQFLSPKTFTKYKPMTKKDFDLLYQSKFLPKFSLFRQTLERCHTPKPLTHPHKLYILEQSVKLRHLVLGTREFYFHMKFYSQKTAHISSLHISFRNKRRMLQLRRQFWTC